MVAKEKFLPINLKRAMLLSDVFTEKRNQLKFQKVLKQMEKELVEKENKQIVEQMDNYKMEQLKKRELELNNKVLLGKRLKNEILELNVKKRKEKLKQIEKEREEIFKINQQLEEDEKNGKNKIIETKLAIDKMHQQDVQAKLQQFEAYKKLEKEEYNIAEAQREFLDDMKEMRNSILKSIHVKKPPKIVFDQINSEKEVIRRCYDLPLVKKSKLEEKRELYSKHLKQDRIKGYEIQINELTKYKKDEQNDRKNEYKRRCENIKTTNVFKQLKHRHVLEKIKEYRNIWNHQLIEKKQSEDENKQEDVQRREKLLEKIRREDEKYLNTVTSVLEDYKRQDKIIQPIVKCLRSGYCS
ncbi:cilia- and flagella-associated protein 45-like [Planococcus citri]|uniref:cilia- and flagella-associated protein 45-like n=1 Tax=Planococcus citri TaxID=170843 RepID=UPI0031F8C2A0